MKKHIGKISFIIIILGFFGIKATEHFESLQNFFCFVTVSVTLVSIFYFFSWLVDLGFSMIAKRRNKMLRKYFKKLTYDDLMPFKGERFFCTYGKEDRVLATVYINEEGDGFFEICKKGIYFSKCFELLEEEIKERLLEEFEKDLFIAKEQQLRKAEEWEVIQKEIYEYQADKIKRLLK